LCRTRPQFCPIARSINHDFARRYSRGNAHCNEARKFGRAFSFPYWRRQQEAPAPTVAEASRTHAQFSPRRTPRKVIQPSDITTKSIRRFVALPRSWARAAQSHSSSTTIRRKATKSTTHRVRRRVGILSKVGFMNIKPGENGARFRSQCVRISTVSEADTHAIPILGY
jgi:hypothetical protein